MAEIFRPRDGVLDISDCLPADFQASSRLATQVLDAVVGLFAIDRMSWRPKMDNAVVYLRLNDERPIFSDMVAGLAVLRPAGARGQIRLGFTREPATDALQARWTGTPPIVRKRAWPNPVLDVNDEQLGTAEEALRTYRDLLLEYADSGALKRGGTSRPEVRMRQLLQRMFPEAGYHSTRPSWLLGQKGKPLELDIYSEVQRIAVEVQGPYHELPINGAAALEGQQARDALKRQRCAEYGVSLLLADAGALDLEIFTLPVHEQESEVRQMLDRAVALGVYEWPERPARA